MNEITRGQFQHSTVLDQTTTTLDKGSSSPTKKSAKKIQNLIPTTQLNACSITTSKKRSRRKVKKKNNPIVDKFSTDHKDKIRTAKKLEYRPKKIESKARELPEMEGPLKKTSSLFQKATSPKEESRGSATDDMSSLFNSKLSFASNDKPKVKSRTTLDKSTINRAKIFSAKILEERAKSSKRENERIIILEHSEEDDRVEFLESYTVSENETPSESEVIIKIRPYGYKEVVSKKDLLLLKFSEF